MAATAAPYGLRPSKMLGNRYNNGSIRQIKIASAYDTSIFFGDLVTTASGLLVKDAGTTTAKPVGVFMGCEYVDSVSGLRHSQYFPADTAAPSGTTIWGYVCDDPDMLFQIQSDESLAQAALGLNAAIVQGAGSTATGMSGVALDGGSIDTTATLPLRIIDFVSPVGDAYTDVLVKINTHAHYVALGI